MNEYERRMIDLAQNHVNMLAAATADGNRATIVPYIYSLRLGSFTNQLIAGQSYQGIIPIQADSYFLMSYITSAIQFAADLNNIARSNTFLLQITDTGNGAVINSQPQVGELLTGSSTFQMCGIPLLVTIPRVIRPNTNLKIDVNYFGASASGLFISFVGAKVFTQ